MAQQQRVCGLLCRRDFYCNIVAARVVDHYWGVVSWKRRAFSHNQSGKFMCVK